MVQFSNGEFNFLQYGGLNASHLKALSSASTGTSAGMDAMGNMQQRITMQLPLPTPVSALGQAGATGNETAQVNQAQILQKQQLAPSGQPQQPTGAPFMLPQGPLMNQLAQLLAQQASNMMQQQQQQQAAGSAAQQMQRLQALPRTGSQPQVAQQMQPAPLPTHPQAPQAQLTQQQQAMLQRIATMQQQAVAQQQQQQQQAVADQQQQAAQQQQQQQQAAAQQQQQMTTEQQRQLSQLQATVAQAQAQASAAQQQQPSQQLQFNGDPNALLQQLQFAQLQQQFQAAQAHASSQAMAASQSMKPPPLPVASKGSGPLSVPSDVQEQLKVHFNRAQNQQGAIAPTPVLPRSSDGVAFQVSKKVKSVSKDGGMKPAAKMKSPPYGNAIGSTFPRTTTLVSSVEVTSSSGLITASDTDGEMSRKTKKSKIMEAARSDSPLYDDDDYDDDDDDEPVSAEVKAKTNRDRNREHARNTRLRKKAYLEKLKTTVDELCRERDTLVSERAGAANLLVEMHNTRTEVLMSLFALRSTNEKRRDLWASILDESCFSCVVPVTPYRSFPASEVQVSKCQRTIMGIDGMIADTSSLHVLFDSLVDRSRFPLGKIEFRYTLITEEAVVAGNQMMARWTMSTVNAVQCGVKMEVSKSGMLCCRFNSGHKIIGLELMFDVMAFMLQLKQAAGTETFSVIPNTVQTCQRTFEKPVVMTLAEPPYTIIQVNSEWEKMTGYTAEEVVGKANTGILQGSSTDRKSVDEMMNEIRFRRPFSTVLMNVKKSGEVFRNFLLLFPLSTDSRITHYIAITDFVDHPSSSGLSLSQLQAPSSLLVTQLKPNQDSNVGKSAIPSGQASFAPSGIAASGSQRSASSGSSDAFNGMPPPPTPTTPGSKAASLTGKRSHESV
jgi:PAS domain S-box-containing protein